MKEGARPDGNEQDEGMSRPSQGRRELKLAAETCPENEECRSEYRMLSGRTERDWHMSLP